MNCKKCGYPLTVDDKFCKNCGTVVDGQNNLNSFDILKPEEGVQPNVGIIPNVFDQPVNNQGMNQTNMGAISNVSEQPVNNQGMNQPNIGGMPNVFEQPVNNQGMNQPPIIFDNSSRNSFNPSNSFQPKKSNFAIKLIFIGLAVVIVGLIAFLAVSLLGNKSGSNGTNVSQSTTKTYKVNYDNFTFSVPDNLVYDIRNDLLYIGDEDGTWMVQFEIVEGSFSQLVANKSLLQQTFQQSGYSVTPAVEKKLAGVDYITLEVGVDGQNMLAACARLNAMYLVGLSVYNVDNDFDYSVLEKMASIINSAEQSSSSTNNLSINKKFDFNLVSDLAK